jgi:putative transposase
VCWTERPEYFTGGRSRMIGPTCFWMACWLKVRRAFGPRRVLSLVAYGIRRNGTRELLAFTRTKGESQAGWEGLLNDLCQRGLRGQHLQLVITDGCPGLARALETVYPRIRHQRCWAHKMRNILEKAKRRDEKQFKSAAQKIYLAANWPAQNRLLSASAFTGAPLSEGGAATGTGLARLAAFFQFS